MNLTALANTFTSTCCKRSASPLTSSGTSPVSTDSVTPLLAAAALVTSSGGDDDIAQIDHRELDVHLAGDDARHVQQILDHSRL